MSSRIAIFLMLLLASACASSPHSTNTTTPGSTGELGAVRFAGGNGRSIEQAIEIRGAKNEREGVAAERLWCAKNLPGWSKAGQALISKESGKSYDKITLRARDGREREIYFDISDFFGKF